MNKTQKVAVILHLGGVLPLLLVNFCEYSSNRRGNASIMSGVFWRTRIAALERTFIVKRPNKSRKVAVIFDLAGVSTFRVFLA